jgi:tRNA nucleotidyltransferase/poly(A) polymerase
MKIYEVGGAVRDELLNVPYKDVDYAVETGSFDEMKMALRDMGFSFYLVEPEYFTIRAKAPKASKLGNKSKVVDFVLCRKDGPSKDGRRPDYVEPGTIYDDLARRDFTINAIARDTDTGEFIDPHGGIGDLERKILRFVGDPMLRIVEDGLRVLRALRFWITKELVIDPETKEALNSKEATVMLHSVSVERIREELHKMFSHNTILSLLGLSQQNPSLLAAIFRDELRLEPTLRLL